MTAVGWVYSPTECSTAAVGEYTHPTSWFPAVILAKISRMKNVVIILVCALVFAAAGLVGAAVVSRSVLNSRAHAAQAAEPKEPDGSLKHIAQLERWGDVATQNMETAQKWGVAGGVVGLLLGIGAGVGISSLTGKKPQ
jgi:hypothetical protein